MIEEHIKPMLLNLGPCEPHPFPPGGKEKSWGELRGRGNWGKWLSSYLVECTINAVTDILSKKHGSLEVL